MAPEKTMADGPAWGTRGWRAVLGRPLWVLSAGAGMGVVLGMTVWAGTALASGSGTATPNALQSQITALQRRMAQDEATISGLQSLLRGVTRSGDGSTLVITGNGAGAGAALKTVLFKGVNVQVVNGTGIETRLNGLGNLIIGYAATANGGISNNDSILGGANEVIGTPIRCGFFPVSPAMSHC